MTKKGITLILLLLTIVALPSLAQSRKNLRINEVMVAADTTGQPSGWIELYNSSYGSIAIEKMFLTTLHADEIFTPANAGQDRDVIMRALCESRPDRCYVIPRGDERNTKIPPRGFAVFNADGNIAAGTFHLPFTLIAGSDNYIALYDVNGECVDQVTVPASLPVAHSYAIASEGRLPITGIQPDTCWQVRDGKTVANAITRGNFNARLSNENIEKFHHYDPSGIILTLTAMMIVFSALILLYFCFKLFGKISSKSAQADTTDTAEPTRLAATAATTAADDNNAVYAAIAMAIHQHFDAHDQESGVITIDHTHEDHSAWNSKISAMGQMPHHE